MTLEGRVSSVVADRMEITTTDATSTFFWRGPPLDLAFAVDDAVQIVAKYLGVYAFSDPWVSIVRSDSATATTVDGYPYTGFSIAPGSKATLPGLEPGFPALVYGLTSCCLESSYSYPPRYSCDYSALEATSEGSSSAITSGATGVVGPWSVTNLHSSFFSGSESTWAIEVTLLGPATPRAVGGGS